MLREGGATGFDRYDAGVKGILTFIAVTAASDIGGYVAGVLFGKHPMAPVISPKKSWEGFAGSAVFCVAVGVAMIVWVLDADWWIGVCLGLIAVVMATLGDLCESVIKRDLGIKDMSQVIPGPRRPDGPPRLAARHDRPDLAAAALPGVSDRSYLVRHGRPLVDRSRPAHEWYARPGVRRRRAGAAAAGCPAHGGVVLLARAQGRS